MNGVRFYKDIVVCPPEGKTYATSFNGCALFPDDTVFLHGSMDNFHAVGVAPTIGAGDGPYGPTLVTGGYKRGNLVRVSEGRARELFPKLFKYLKENHHENL